MIDVFFYSISGKKTNTVVDDIIQQFLSSDYVPSADKKILNHTVEVAKNGNYPSRDYYKNFYSTPSFEYNSLAEIVTYSQKALDFYKTQFLSKKILGAINESNSSSELINSIESVISDKRESDVSDLSEFGVHTYSDELERPTVKGCTSGIPEIEALTFGFIPGTVASICAFTGHGKSTFVVSSMFKNILEGKKGLLMSIEVAPDLVWLQFQARYLYEVKGLNVTYPELQHKKLTSEMARKVAEYDEDFKRDIGQNLMILDESVLSKSLMLNYRSIASLFRSVEKKLGGLDLVAWDHIGQLELLYPECGNQMIKQIQSVTKTYKNSNDVLITTIMAVQTNREGEKRARRREGNYDIQAISDLNEVERTSSYIIFMYTSDDMKVVQETKVCLKKQRQGPIMPEPITTTFNPSVCVVGTTVEKIEVLDEDFGLMGSVDFNEDEF